MHFSPGGSVLKTLCNPFCICFAKIGRAAGHLMLFALSFTVVNKDYQEQN
ncbi:MAG: hypothetical protein ACK42Z_07590 [Candidatus Kapaibacteriota bacterium]